MDTELFFSGSWTRPRQAELAQIKAICALCPVQPQCLAWAAERGVDHGIWGGLTETERRSITVRRRHRFA